MGMRRTADRVQANKNSSIQSLDARLQSLIDSDDPADIKRADLISYWIRSYSLYLKQEITFDPRRLINYRKGDIVKINLGYRIGNEEGGLHFGVVQDVNNSNASGVVTIIPLTSYKPGKAPHRDSVDIGREVFQAVISKHDKLHAALKAEVIEINEKIKDNAAGKISSDEVQPYLDRLDVLEDKIGELTDLRNSILKMKQGSIALVNQIVTVSKMRITDPLYSNHVLYGIRLSDTTISAIDNKLCDLFVRR